jgi:DNA-binding response OmpR family regulator
MQETILFMDNNPRFLDVQSRLLEQLGYKVLRALTVAEAEEKLANERIHLAIFDIRMEDEDDGQDISGLLLAQNKSFQPVPKIILTAHTGSRDTYKYARDVLGPTENGLPPAVNFIGKDEGPHALLEAVERAIQRHVRINWHLLIRWEEAGSFAHLSQIIEPRGSALQCQLLADEVEDLFRKLFYTHVQITLGPVLFQRNGQVILAVFAYPPARGEEQYVISCGRRQQIAEEEQHYEQLIHKQAGVGRIEKVQSAQTVHFAITAYSLTGARLEEITPFAFFYQRNTVDVIQAAISNLFGTVLVPWYKPNRSSQMINNLHTFMLEWLALDEETFDLAKLAEQGATLCRAVSDKGWAKIEYLPHKLSLSFAPNVVLLYANPVAYLRKQQPMAALPMLYTISHGQINSDTVLINNAQQSWLINFSHTGHAPLLRDFVSLEVSIKAELFDTVDLQLRHELEQRLLLPVTLAEAINTDDLPPDLNKALQTIAQIRQLAAAQAGPALEPYLLGLLCAALECLTLFDPTLRYNRRELVYFAHCFLMAAMLCERLSSASETSHQVPAQALRSLWIDDMNKEAWVEGKRVELTPQDFELLAYLYQHTGQLCSRQAIVRTVFGVEYEEEDELIEIERSRLNSAISRLRQKLEPDPDNPQYLVTIRGQGYKLLRGNAA